MSDIVERLKHLEQFEWSKLTEPCNAVLSVYEARCALAEIERLRAELDKWRNRAIDAVEKKQ